MNLFLLNLDNSLSNQQLFLDFCKNFHVHELNAMNLGNKVRLWSTENYLRELRDLISSSLSLFDFNYPLITFMGSGDFHHISAELLFCLNNDYWSRDITIIHFDNHPDWVNYSKKSHCGSWVNKALKINRIKKIISVGIDSNDLIFPELKDANLNLLKNGSLSVLPYRREFSYVFKNYGSGDSHTTYNNKIYWQPIINLNENDLFKKIQNLIATEHVYITIDKDVLVNLNATTNWDQGKINLDYLFKILSAIIKNNKLLGIDIVGDYSYPHYDGNLIEKLLKYAEVFIDQPRVKINFDAATAQNCSTNILILKFLNSILK
jgi:arginase family enzyme